MDSDNSTDNLGLRNSSPRQSNNNNNKNSSTLFGLWPKRSTKVEPHPIIDLTSSSDPNHIGNNINKTDISFAKCSPQKRTKQSSQERNDSIVDKQYELQNNNINKNSSITNNNIVNFRKTPNKSNNNNNRFSHQFSLCCKVDRKTSTPPMAVSVRYNSSPDIITAREKLLLNLTEHTAPLAEVSECNSAPETPVHNNKSQSFNSHSSPSTNSVQSTRSTDSQQQSYQQMQHLELPRSIAMSACRSRLRLKLLPPGKSIIDKDYGVEINSINGNNDKYDDYGAGGDGLRDQQHMSSPNLPIQKEFGIEIQNRSVSHDGIQVIKRQSGSTDLARQALMAAQVLSLIPTEKARERNYLANRLACSSLLGATELLRVLPTKQLSIFVGTWNMNGQSPPKQMNDFVLPSSVEHVPDLIAIGTQESCSERYDWEVTLQETLGPSHVLFHSASLGTLHLAVFLRRDLIWFCSVPEDSSMSVRPGTAFRTKGAVAISFCLFGTSMLFVTSHLTAHQQKVKERVHDVKRITHSLDLPRNLNIRHKNKDVTQNFDSVFWCGDLNFRLAEPRERILEWIEKTKFPLPAHLPHGYMHTDQLSSVLLDGAAFKGFMEANITFPPTYKYDPGTQQFDTSSKQRAPAYTDRILYKYRMPNIALRRASAISSAFLSSPNVTPLECIAYDSAPSIISSDHKPVWALFRNTIKPGVDSIPLAAGLFMREVYVDGMRRRLNNNYSGSSAVCSIQ